MFIQVPSIVSLSYMEKERCYRSCALQPTKLLSISLLSPLPMVPTVSAGVAICEMGRMKVPVSQVCCEDYVKNSLVKGSRFKLYTGVPVQLLFSFCDLEEVTRFLWVFFSLSKKIGTKLVSPLWSSCKINWVIPSKKCLEQCFIYSKCSVTLAQ